MSRTRTLHLLATLVAALSLVFALGACGGGGGDSDAQGVIDRATLEGIDSGDLALTVGVRGDGEKGGKAAFRLAGVFQSQGEGKLPQLDMTASGKGRFGGEKIDFEGGLVLLANSAYVNYEGVEYEVDPTTFSFVQSVIKRSEQESGGEGSSACQEAFGELEVAEFVDNLTSEGSAEVGGTATTKVSGDLDVGTALDSVVEVARGPACESQLAAAGELPSEGEIDDAKSEVNDSVKSARADVYVGEDDIVRRISAKVAIEPQDREPGDPQKVDLVIDMRLTGVNEEQTISAPAKARPLSQLFIKLGVNPIELIGMLGGEGGGEGLGELLEGLDGLKGLGGFVR